MNNRKKKIEFVKCSNKEGKEQIDSDNPPFAILRFPMPMFCCEECLKISERK